MDLHNISVGDVVITSANEEAKVVDVDFCDEEILITFDTMITGWEDRGMDDAWYYYYDGRFVATAVHNNVANIVKVIKHD